MNDIYDIVIEKKKRGRRRIRRSTGTDCMKQKTKIHYFFFDDSLFSIKIHLIRWCSFNMTYITMLYVLWRISKVEPSSAQLKVERKQKK